MSEPGDVARPPRPCSKGESPLPHLRENPVNPVEITKRPHSAQFAPPAAHLQTRARASKTAPTRVLRRFTPSRPRRNGLTARPQARSSDAVMEGCHHFADIIPYSAHNVYGNAKIKTDRRAFLYKIHFLGDATNPPRYLPTRRDAASP